MKKLKLTFNQVKLYAIGAIFVCSLMPNQADAQFDLKKLKDKAKEKVSGNKKENQSRSQNQNQNQDQNKNQISSNISSQSKGGDDFTEMAKFYKSKIYKLQDYPFIHYNFGQIDWSEESLKVIGEFDMPGTLKKMEQDKQKYPQLFKIYPKLLPIGGMNVMKQREIPAIADKAGENEDFAFKDDNARDINDFYRDYIYWKSQTMEKQRDVAQLMNKMINKSEEVRKSEKLDKIAFAIRCIKGLREIQPENPMLDDLEKRANQTQEKLYGEMGDVITGEFHKKYIKKLVGFTSKPQIGKEDPSTVSNEIIPGKPFYLVGYFSDKMRNLEVTRHIKGVPLTSSPVLIWNEIGSNNNGRMELYWNEGMVEKLKEQSYFIFEMFPDINTVNFKSHVEYIPIMNLVKWFTYQMPGEYQFSFQFGGSATIPFLSENTFTLKLTKESIQELKTYYDKLAQKKLLAVTINQAAGCTDQKAKIGGKEALNKYGEPVKITCTETGKVMKPWPNDNQVDYFTGFGYGVFKRTDGKYEIIKLDFRRSPSSNQFDFSGANVMSHYGIEGSFTIKSDVLNLGYEITREGIEKCTMW